MIGGNSIGDRFSRSWEITKQTFHVMKADKEILLFPVLSTIFSLILFVALVVPVFFSGLLFDSVRSSTPLLGYLLLLLFYFVVTFSATFFNAGTVHIAKTRFEGGDATFMDGIRAGLKHLKAIAAWSILTATIGLLLNILQRQAREKGGIGGLIGSILVGIVGFAWAIVSVFVVPAIVINDQGPIQALKSSALAIKKTWGESLIRYYGLGLVQALINGLGALVFLLPGILLLFTPFTFLGVALIGVFILWLMLVSVVFSSANTVFNTALFLYADRGEVPSYYNQETLMRAFKPK